MRATKPLRELHLDAEADSIIEAANGRNKRCGSGDLRDLLLLVVDETRRRTVKERI